ncbi:hypothetical protein F7Q99_38235 [Streptomyces kaniharaensis]|uniref:Uncharacterized protein n=1 Tax=Streptomyces kaniharaensis TaxID=212423 RepID=A0A6N7L5Z1_9ACTN|nr:hypothetical protein [Streptomyces kaniharaensis]MQS17874.1 hypothetical protein [Streptomyces kaniharaensis]
MAGRIAAFFGLGSSNSGSGTSGGTSARSGRSSSRGWRPAVPLPGGREVHPAPAATDRSGRRVYSPDPYTGPNASATRRNFGRPGPWPEPPAGSPRE